MENLVILDDKLHGESETKQVSQFDRLNKWFLDSQKVKLKDKVTFYRLLATMVNSGITVLQALRILHSQQKNKVMRRLQSQMIDGVRSGKNLSSTLKDHPHNF